MAKQQQKQPTSRKAVSKKPPAKAQREQAANRREAKRDGLPLSEATLSPFVACFCQEFVRWGILEEAHYNAERITREPLDLSGFEVHEERWERSVKGKTVTGITRTITDPATGWEVPMSDIRAARAAQLWHMPEVKAEIARLKQEAATSIRVTAEILSGQCDQIYDHAVRSGQLQVAANVVAMKGKMFGVEAGSADPGLTPVTAVEIRIRDYTGKPKASKDLDN